MNHGLGADTRALLAVCAATHSRHMAKWIAVALGAGSLWSRGSARNRPSITASTESPSQQTLQSPHECWDSVGEAVFSSATYADEKASRDKPQALPHRKRMRAIHAPYTASVRAELPPLLRAAQARPLPDASDVRQRVGRPHYSVRDGWILAQNPKDKVSAFSCLPGGVSPCPDGLIEAADSLEERQADH